MPFSPIRLGETSPVVGHPGDTMSHGVNLCEAVVLWLERSSTKLAGALETSKCDIVLGFETH